MAHWAGKFGLLVPFLFTACSGQMYHSPEDSLTAARSCGATGDIRCGVPYYNNLSVIQTNMTTTSTDRDGNVVATQSGIEPGTNRRIATCTPVTTEQIVNIPDMSQRQIIWYEPGVLEAYTVNIALSANGTLSSVGATSTPDQGRTFENVASGIASLASAAGQVAAIGRHERSLAQQVQPQPPQGKPACNAGSIIQGVRRYNISMPR